MLISYLEDHPEFIPLLAPSIVEHYSPTIPGENIQSRIAKLRRHLHKDKLPIAWVAHSDGEVFGTAALRTHDLEGREDLSPWLGGVFVLSKYRMRGIASELCKVVEEKAWSLGFKAIYLFTPDQQSLYARLGWRESERAVWHGHESHIMVKSNNAP